MEYPGTHFTRPIRLALLIVFIGLFLVISPLLIMYTAGYRYDWKNGLLKETGAINIDIEPDTATVYLNNVKLQDQIPVRLNNIVPAKYNVRISDTGYFDWNKEIEVKNKQTNYIKEISLLKKSKPEMLVAGNITDFNVSADGKFIIYVTEENNATGIWLWDNETQQTNSLFRLAGEASPTIVWAEKNNYVAIIHTSSSLKQISLVDALNPLVQVNLSKQNPDIEKIQWADSVEPTIYYSTKNSIFSYSPLTQNNQTITANKFVDWHMENGQLWTLAINSSTRDYVLTKDTLGFSTVIKQIKNDNLNIENDGDLQSPSTQIGITLTRQNTALLKTNTRNRMLLVNSNTVQPMQVENFLISKYNNWWLMWSNWELWSYNENENPYLLNRSGEHLEEVIPLDKYNTLALVWANKTTALFPYYTVSHDLLNEKISNPIADTDNKTLYFIENNNQDKNGGGIWKLNY